MSADTPGNIGDDGDATENDPLGGVPPKAAVTMYLSTYIYRLLVIVLVFGGAILFVRWAFLPLARVIVGRTTTFEFSFGVNVSLALNVALGVALGASEVGRRRANRELRNSEPPAANE